MNWALRALRVPKIWGFPLMLIISLTTVLRTTVLHCDYSGCVNECNDLNVHKCLLDIDKYIIIIYAIKTTSYFLLINHISHVKEYNDLNVHHKCLLDMMTLRMRKTYKATHWTHLVYFVYFIAWGRSINKSINQKNLYSTSYIVLNGSS